VPTRDRPVLLRGCLAELAGALGPGDELIVADSASAGRETAAVAGEAGATLLTAPVPGASLARNLGWRAARHELVAFVDDDVRVAPGWAGAVVAAFADPGVAFVTGRIEVPPAQAGVEAPVALHDRPEAAVIDGSGGAMPGHSANLAVRRSALLAVSGFDEAFGPGHRFVASEDADLFDRLLAAGLRGRYEPAALAFHEQWRGRRERVRLDYRYGVGAGARLAKLARTDRSRARVVAGEVVVRWGIRTLASDLRRGYRFGVLSDAARLAGMLAGFGAALPTPIREGHFAERRGPGRRPDECG